MLTIRETLIAAGQVSGGVLSAGALRSQFSGPSKAFSMARIGAAFEQQRRIYFVSLVSPRIFLSPDVNNFDDFQRLMPDYHGQMTREEVVAFSTGLQSQDIFLKFVDTELRGAALVGTVGALNLLPAITVNNQNFTTIKDWSSGATKVGGGFVSAGTLIIAVVAVGPAAAAAGAETAVVVGAGVAAFGIGFLIGTGVIEILNDSKTPTTPASDKTKSEVDSPDIQDDGDPETIDIPNAVAVGDAPNGLDVDGLVTDLGNLAISIIESGISDGWDQGSGSALPSFGGDGGDGSGDGSGGVSFPA